MVGDCRDLSRFEDDSIDEIYASHVLEHLSYRNEIVPALKEWRRVLLPGAVVKSAFRTLRRSAGCSCGRTSAPTIGAR